MGQCKKCFGYFPPTLMFELNGEDKQCVFCKVDKDYITLEKGDRTTKYTRKQCMEDYRKFMKGVVEKPEVREALAKEQGEKLS